MNKFILKTLLLFSCISLGAQSKVFVRATKDNAVYKVGEEITFEVKKYIPNSTYTITDGYFTTEQAILTKEPIKYTPKQPGFVLVTISYPNKNNKLAKTYAGVAVEPQKIVAGTTLPKDFDEFWNNELTKLRSEALEIKETKVSSKLLPKNIEAVDVFIKRGDIIATAFVAYPKNAKTKSLSGCLTFLGASKVNAELPVALFYAKKFNCIAINVNFHGFENHYPVDKDKLKTARIKTANYRYNFAGNKDLYAMRKIFLRTVLAAEYIMQHPLYDGNTLVATGGSLGGCQSIVCTALVPEVKLCISNATAMCDHFGKKAKHIPGWPLLLKNVPAAEKSAGYFDVVNFMHRIKVPVRMAVGFIDTTCSPASTYAAFNTLTIKDKIMKHTVTGNHGAVIDKKDTGVFDFWTKEVGEFLVNKKLK